eukprot:1161200-Pelagomonas_calceolata.AAC.8
MRATQQGKHPSIRVCSSLTGVVAADQQSGSPHLESMRSFFFPVRTLCQELSQCAKAMQLCLYNTCLKQLTVPSTLTA